MQHSRNALADARVLIVEDSPDLATLYSAILRAHGAKTTIACTMRDGLSKSFKSPPDLILCDLSMAHGSGLDFIGAVRAMEKGTGHHVVAAAVTGHYDDASLAAATAAGFDDCICKPVTNEVLIDSARRLLGEEPRLPGPATDGRGGYTPPGRSSSNSERNTRSPF